jgi:hypothetical protein
MNIALTILQKKFEETPLLRIRCGYLDLRTFQGGGGFGTCRGLGTRSSGHLVVDEGSFACDSYSVHRPDRWRIRSTAAPRFY